MATEATENELSDISLQFTHRTMQSVQRDIDKVQSDLDELTSERNAIMEEFKKAKNTEDINFYRKAYDECKEIRKDLID